MYNKAVTTLLLLLAVASFASAKYISSITVDGTSEQVIVLEYDENPLLYEIDSASQTQTSAHHFSGVQNGELTETNSLYIRKKGAQRSLYVAYENADGSNLTLSTFKLPLAPQQTLPPTDSNVIGDLGDSLDPTYDPAAPFAIFSASRYLNYVNLNTLNTLDSMYYWGNRIFGRNVVRNNNNKHVIVFYTAVPIGAPYGISVDEFDVSTGKFVETSTTYNCQCNTKPRQSPFYKVVLDEASCQIDYTANKIWCSAGGANKGQLFSFQADNLANYNIFNTTGFSRVAWDFANKRAYALKANGNNGFTVSKINLDNGNVMKSNTIANVHIDATVTAVDPGQPRLYVAVFGNENAPTKIVSVNTNNLNAQVLTLNPSV